VLVADNLGPMLGCPDDIMLSRPCEIVELLRARVSSVGEVADADPIVDLLGLS